MTPNPKPPICDSFPKDAERATGLESLVMQAFAPGSGLSQTIAQFKPRSGQTEMAVAIARTIDQGGALVVEAGTGVGKTYAYLVPALLSGTRILLSTATKALQDQLFGRDLPQLVRALGLPLRCAVLKGRASYVCMHRLEMARHDGAQQASGEAQALARVEQWAQATRSGDLAELDGIEDRSALMTQITSTRENCLGAQCPKLSGCHVNQARREAMDADVLVINHHLFFADLGLRETAMGQLLPKVQTLVFDEAHQLNDTGVQFLGRQLTTAQLIDFANDLLATGLQKARGLVDWHGLATGIERAARDLRMVVGQAAFATRLRWHDETPERVGAQEWRAALEDLDHACVQAQEQTSRVAEVDPDLERMRERAGALCSLTESFLKPCPAGVVRWLDVNTQLRLVESPLDIAQALRDAMGSASADTGYQRAWVFTSATLGDEPLLRWFTEPCGLSDATTLRVESPFNYQRQAALYLPAGFADPRDAAHSAQVAALVAQAASRLGGRTLVLTTTLRALNSISDALALEFSGSKRIHVLTQGQGSKRVLMERFRSAGAVDGPGYILVASATFWQGIDIPGDALQLVVIDKLPFPPPNDPLAEARANRLKAAGRSAFKDYFLPEAAVALRQGAGRLIRRESDRGALVLCDGRVSTRGYGRRLLAALPAMRVVADAGEWDALIDDLTRASTKGSPPS